MTDRQKRARLREILADSKGAIAPGVTDPMFARLAADCRYFVQRFGYAQAMTCSRLARRPNAT